MKFNYVDIETMVNSIVTIDKIPYQRGSQLVFYKGKGWYIWRNDKYLFVKGKHFWSKKYKYSIDIKGHKMVRDTLPTVDD